MIAEFLVSKNTAGITAHAYESEQKISTELSREQVQ